MIKAIIFDMDGVLIEAKDWHYEALNKALSLFGFEISRYDHLVTFDGLPTSRKLEMLTVERGLPRSLHGFINEMKQRYTMDYVYTCCKPRFIHQYALSRLKADGYRLALASNSIRKTVELMMDKACLTDYMECMLSNQDVTIAKPNPEIYLKAFAKLGGVKPEECLICEDNQNGIQAALASGAHLFKVDTVNDVTYANIKRRIDEIEKGGKG